MKFLLKTFDIILNAIADFGSFLLAFMTCVITFQVFMRYFFNIAPLWINDAVEYILLGSTLLGAAYVLKKDSHIEIDLVFTILNKKNELRLKMITSFVGAAVCAILTGYGIYTAWDNYIRGVEVYKAVDIQKYLVIAPIGIGFFLLTIQFVRRGLLNLMVIKENKFAEKSESPLTVNI